MSDNYFFQNQPIGLTVSTGNLTVEWESTFPAIPLGTTVSPVEFSENDDQGSPNCADDDVSDKHDETDE